MKRLFVVFVSFILSGIYSSASGLYLDIQPRWQAHIDAERASPRALAWIKMGGRLGDGSDSQASINEIGGIITRTYSNSEYVLPEYSAPATYTRANWNYIFMERTAHKIQAGLDFATALNDVAAELRAQSPAYAHFVLAAQEDVRRYNVGLEVYEFQKTLPATTLSSASSADEHAMATRILSYRQPWHGEKLTAIPALMGKEWVSADRCTPPVAHVAGAKIPKTVRVHAYDSVPPALPPDFTSEAHFAIPSSMLNTSSIDTATLPGPLADTATLPGQLADTFTISFVSRESAIEGKPPLLLRPQWAFQRNLEMFPLDGEGDPSSMGIQCDGNALIIGFDDSCSQVPIRGLATLHKDGSDVTASPSNLSLKITGREPLYAKSSFGVLYNLEALALSGIVILVPDGAITDAIRESKTIGEFLAYLETHARIPPKILSLLRG